MSITYHIMAYNESMLKFMFCSAVYITLKNIINKGRSLSSEGKAQACCCTVRQCEVGDQQSRRHAQINSSPVKWAVRG